MGQRLQANKTWAAEQADRLEDAPQALVKVRHWRVGHHLPHLQRRASLQHLAYLSRAPLGCPIACVFPRPPRYVTLCPPQVSTLSPLSFEAPVGRRVDVVAVARATRTTLATRTGQRSACARSPAHARSFSQPRAQLQPPTRAASATHAHARPRRGQQPHRPRCRQCDLHTLQPFDFHTDARWRPTKLPALCPPRANRQC